LANLCLRHACSTERWVDVEGVGGDPIAHPARIVLEQIRDHDLGVVVRSVRERALAVAVAECPDSRDTSAKLVVDHDVAAPVDGDARPVEAEIVSVGTAADSEQHVRTLYLRCSVGAIDVGNELLAPPGEADALRVHANLDALVFDDLPDSSRNVL